MSFHREISFDEELERIRRYTAATRGLPTSVLLGYPVVLDPDLDTPFELRAPAVVVITLRYSSPDESQVALFEKRPGPGGLVEAGGARSRSLRRRV